MDHTGAIEVNPFKAFVPDNMRVLLIGSFPGREQTQHSAEGQWFYGSKRNQFWTIISGVYQTRLETTEAKMQLFASQGIGVTDIILEAVRLKNTNLDGNLMVVKYNDDLIRHILDTTGVKNVLCTSRFVEKHFRKFFPGFTGVQALPSPSPRYAGMTLAQKIERYRILLQEDGFSFLS